MISGKTKGIRLTFYTKMDAIGDYIIFKEIAHSDK